MAMRPGSSRGRAPAGGPTPMPTGPSFGMAPPTTAAGARPVTGMHAVLGGVNRPAGSFGGARPPTSAALNPLAGAGVTMGGTAVRPGSALRHLPTAANGGVPSFALNTQVRWHWKRDSLHVDASHSILHTCEYTACVALCFAVIVIPAIVPFLIAQVSGGTP